MSVKNLTFVNNNAPACDDAFLNSAKEEPNNAITSSGQSLTGIGDTQQLAKGISNYSASGNFYGCTNTVDAYTLTPVSPFQGISGYKDGQLFRFRPSATNTTQSPTANVNTQGVKNITKADGSTQVEIGDIDSNQDIELRYDLANDVLVLPKLGVTSFLPRGYISGLETENDAGDTAHDIKFNIGTCRDAVDSLDISLGTALVKQLDAVWTAGTGVGGLSSAVSPAIANTTYHMFVISKPDGTVDAGFDTSVTAVNLLADATGYTKYRRVTSMDTDASANWIQYFQLGDMFTFKTKVLDVNTTTMTTANRTLYTMSTPAGIKVDAYVRVLYNTASLAYFLVTSPDETDEAPSATLAPLATDFDDATQASFSTIFISTNTSSQIGVRSSLAGVVEFQMLVVRYRDFFIN